MKKIKKSKTKKLFISGAVIFCFGAISFVSGSSLNEKSIPHQNPVDKKISLYSNQHITKNAILTNPKFQKLTFEARPATKSVLSNQLASVIGVIKSFTINFLKNKPPLEKETGSWLWTPILQMTPEYMDFIIDGTKTNGVDTIYLSIDSYLDIFVMEESTEKENQKTKFSDALENFIKKANQKGIAVDAECGWKDWAEDKNEYKAFAILSFVKDFNNSHKAKFRGFQYDIEPYLLDSYENDKATILKNFVSLMDRSEYFLENNDLRFTIVIPDFYDKGDKATPKFTYNNKNNYVFEHLINILDRKNDSSIIVMSYRNFAKGKDGSIEISTNEMKTAKKYAEKTKIIIAQETGDFLPPYITFYNKTRTDMDNEIAQIKSAFKTNPNFGGIAIHYANAFLALK